MIRPAAFLLFFHLGAAAPAQLAFNELFLDPPGPNAGNQIIELINTSGFPFRAPINWRFCIRPTYIRVPSIQIPAGGIVQVHIGAIGVNTATDWYLPTVAQLSLGGEMAIYATDLYFDTPDFMRAFVSWGGGACPQPLCSRIDIAVQAGLWPDRQEHVELGREGSSAAWFGVGEGPTAFFIDRSPTLGAANQPASFSTFGIGCPAGAAVPAMNITSGRLPWLNESFTLRFSNLPPPPALPFGILGFSESVWGPFTLPQDLAVFGFPGCTQFASVDFSQPLVNNGGTASWTIAVPPDLSLIDLEFFNQGVVLFGAGQGAVSNASRGRLGGPR